MLPEKRWQNGKRYTHNQHFYASIQRYGWDGFTHEILHSDLTHDEACRLEQMYIREWNLRDDRFGYNLTDGGEGCYGRTTSDETRNKLSQSHMGIGKSVPLSDEHREKISLAQIGVPHPHRGRSGIPFSKEHRKSLSDAHKRAVLMYDKDGKLIRRFDCSHDGAKFVGLKTSADINKCCQGNRKSAGGYTWRYE